MFFPTLSLALVFARAPLSERLEQAKVRTECVFRCCVMEQRLTNFNNFRQLARRFVWELRRCSRIYLILPRFNWFHSTRFVRVRDHRSSVAVSVTCSEENVELCFDVGSNRNSRIRAPFHGKYHVI